MQDSFADERESMSVGQHLVVVRDGDFVPLVRNDMYLRVRPGAVSTAITVSPVESLPYGLRFTADNTEGSGDFTINSTEVVVPAGDVYGIQVAGAGNGAKVFIIIGTAEVVRVVTTATTLQAALDDDADDKTPISLVGGAI